jgi:protein involved in polysaccharide export with SLBB domain
MRSVLVLILGIAIGYSLNLGTLRLLIHGPLYPTALPPYVIEAPDILQISLVHSLDGDEAAIAGQHLVGPDGRINLGRFGSMYVAGLTLDAARAAVEKQLSTLVKNPEIALDMFAYNSKTYYVITQSAAQSDSVQQFPITGNETVLDAIAHLGGTSIPASVTLFVSRPASGPIGREKILPINWQELRRGGSMDTNYQITPRDRLIISDHGTRATGT